MLRAGNTLGGFRVDDVLGVGGMGIVYRAEQLSLGRPVALKVLSGSLVRDAGFRERFRREGKHAASLEHPNIVPIYDSGETEGRLYIAMRLVDGATLAELISTHGLSADQAIKILSPIARALDTAHAAGLVHRDVKPQNILVSSTGHPYLTDFGVAKSSNTYGLTTTAGFIGSVHFASPEQITGTPLTAASDIYALAAILYQCLTGKPPFSGESDAAIMHAHLHLPPPTLTVVSKGDDCLNHVISRGMAKSPDVRYRHAGELIDAATRCLRGLSDTKRQATPLFPNLVDVPEADGKGAPGHTRRSSRSIHDVTIADVGRAEPGSQGPPAKPPRDKVASPSDESEDPRSSSNGHIDALAAKEIALVHGFKFTHGPLPEDGVIPLLGRASLLDRLVGHLQYSDGGSLLLTGMRGVGKTTLVEHAIAELKGKLIDSHLIAVKVNVARPRSLGELLYEIIRRIYEQLNDHGLLDELPSDLRDHLETAFHRTHKTITRTLSNGRERSGGMRFGGPLGTTFDGSGKVTRAETTESSFLEYGESDVEYDFTRIVELLGRGGNRTSGRRTLKRIHRKRPKPWRARLVVVVDELDKLSETPTGIQWLRGIVTTMKNVLTSPNTSFIFVAGQDLYDEILSEHRQGNSLYDSIFAWRMYVHCIWRSEETLLAALVADHTAFDTLEITWLRDSLAYFGRGVPRLLLTELGMLVRRDERGQFIALTPSILTRLSFYSELQAVVRRFIRTQNGSVNESYIDRDRWRLSAYYTVDLILAFREAFTLEDVLKASSQGRASGLLLLSEPDIGVLVEMLVAGDFIEPTADTRGGKLHDHGDHQNAAPVAYVVKAEVTPDLFVSTSDEPG